MKDNNFLIQGDFKPNHINFISSDVVWLKTSLDGEIELFDIEEMKHQAKLGCPYAKAFNAVYEYGKQVKDGER